ncbi:MAG: hypothetical protein QM754_10720 [Tepidisphaeraceae bacterium]
MPATQTTIDVMSIGAIAIWFRRPVARIYHVANAKSIEPTAWVSGVPHYNAKQIDAIEKAVNKHKPDSPRIERGPVSPSWTRVELSPQTQTEGTAHV